VASDGRSVTLSDASSVLLGDAIERSGEWALVTGIDGNVLSLDRVVGFGTGAAIIYRAIPFALEWLPKFAPPGKMHHFIESALQLRVGSFAQALVSYETDLDPAIEPVPIDTDWQGMERDHPATVVPIPRNKARGASLRIRFDHCQARSPVSVEALTVSYSPGTASVRPRILGAGLPGVPALDALPLDITPLA
jgi:hypothetical protein